LDPGVINQFIKFPNAAQIAIPHIAPRRETTRSSKTRAEFDFFFTAKFQGT
jgi:hypothetical protein